MYFPMMMTVAVWLAGGALAIWLWLALFRGGFWRANQRLLSLNDDLPHWPEIVAVIPARDEAETIADAVRSIAEQNYPAAITIVVVDDCSSDGTADAARSVIVNADRKLEVVGGSPLPDGWTGKMWAVSQGVDQARRLVPDAGYLLLTDADISHGSNILRNLVTKADRQGLDLVSLMVKLCSRSPWEKLLIPAFVFFFQKLFPFSWVNNPTRAEAAAAGGCMLVRNEAISRIGGIACIRDRVIDDCALAAAIKPGGAIWLGLAEDSHSLRGYDGLGGLWDMVARTAFVQLKNSYLLLIGTVLGMIVLYLVPPLTALLGTLVFDFRLALIGLSAWFLMAFLYLPTIRLYGMPEWQALLLPLSGIFYTAMTVDSAWRTWRGRGAGWKGRSYGS